MVPIQPLEPFKRFSMKKDPPEDQEELMVLLNGELELLDNLLQFNMVIKDTQIEMMFPPQEKTSESPLLKTTGLKLEILRELEQDSLTQLDQNQPQLLQDLLLLREMV